jgi:hypothetical protein
MKLRILIAGVLGGIVLFNWGFVSHMVLPLGMMGMRSIPDEGAVSVALKRDIPEPGMYMVPGMDLSKNPTAEQLKQREDKAKAGPSGLLIVNPLGVDPDLTPHLIKEVLTNIVSALFAAMLLAQLRTNYAGRVLFIASLGLFAWIVVCVPNWNWYSYPLEFTVARAIDYVVGWLLVGIVIGAIVKHPKVVEKAPAAA